MWFPIIVLVFTIALTAPTYFIRKKYKSYTQKMKEDISVDNILTKTNEDIKRYMVAADIEVKTTSLREQTYTYFVEQFTKELITGLNNSTETTAQKIKKLEQVKEILTMKFDVKALEKLDEAIAKLKGDVTL